MKENNKETMKFDDAKEKMSTIRKLHTARDNEGETIFYKKPYSAQRLTVITADKNVDSFDLDKTTHVSLSVCGLMIQYKPVNEIKIYPYTLPSIKDIIIES